MKLAAGVLGALILAGASGNAAENKLPLVDGKPVVATVNEEPIFLDELNRTLAAAHADRREATEGGRIDYSRVMARLINTRLMLLEARNMGLGELPEIVEKVEGYRRKALMELLLDDYVQTITLAPDDPLVDKIYQSRSREWKEWEITAVNFDSEPEAHRFLDALKAGRDFDDLVKEVNPGENGVEVVDRQPFKSADLRPEIAVLVANMKVGTVSPLMMPEAGKYVIFKLVGERYPQQAASVAREAAHSQALYNRRAQAVKAYVEELKKTYVKLDDKLFAELDFEAAEPGIENLLQDDRILVKIKGQPPVTVAAFTQMLKDKFFHGVEQAIKSGKVNAKKEGLLEELTEQNTLEAEAHKKDLGNDPRFKSRIRDYENSILFGMFIEKVIRPEVVLTEKEIRDYYEKNVDEFKPPRMMRIKSLEFQKNDSAENAYAKLTQGTDYDWLAAHAEDRLAKSTPGLLNFDGSLVVVDSLPEKVRALVADAQEGDYRLYADPAKGHFYVLSIYQVTASGPRPFDTVKTEIAEKRFERKMQQTIESWCEKLKAFYPVKIYQEDLR